MELTQLVVLASLIVTAKAGSDSKQKGESNSCQNGYGSVTVSGIQGAPGVQGKDGEKGNKGDRGMAGKVGPKGDAGEPGRVGERGVRGVTGPRGQPGITPLHVCSNNSNGVMRYNQYVKQIEYCDGNNWLSLMQLTLFGSSPLLPASSCRQISVGHTSNTNGQYWIRPSSTDPPFQVFCDAGEGWTLIMKIDGNQQNFNYDNVLWSNKQTFQSNNLDLDNKETKLASYWTLPFTELRLGMKVDRTIRWITFSYKASSLYSLIADGQYRMTSIGKIKWRSLLPASSLQRNCNKEGFNVRSNHSYFDSITVRARLGFIANEQNECNSPDSFVGFGTAFPFYKVRNSAGNYAHSSSDNGSGNIKAIGYIMAR